MNADQPFWQTKTLGDMSVDEWEALCDGCGHCCLVKLEDEDTGEIYTTDVSCALLDCDTCTCTNYATRHQLVDDCIKLSVDNLDALSWLPPTCAYRLVGEGKPLPEWHYLVSGSRETVHETGISVRGRVTSEAEVPVEDLPERIFDWGSVIGKKT